jgi:spore maturation protein CgeB
MKLVIFGLTISSSWGNGHATLWRGLLRALARRGHRFVFFERDVPYYAAHRDQTQFMGGELVLYANWREVLSVARRHLAEADVGMITSYCPDAVAASELVQAAPLRCLRTFYDLDTPVTLEHLRAGQTVGYLGARGLRDFELVLSYTGGEALTELQTRLGAQQVVPLYGSVDPDAHRPVRPSAHYAADLSYLGTYSADRQARLEMLFIEAARRLPQRRFRIGGAQYPAEFPWTPNIFFNHHVPPPEHAAFYCSSRLTLNVTRAAMAAQGYCPSGRLFEAAACGAPLLSDSWEGLDQFFQPMQALELSDTELAKLARAARERTLAEHTAERRAIELEAAFAMTRSAALQEV